MNDPGKSAGVKLLFLIKVGQNLLRDIDRTVFTLLEGSAHIFANDSDSEKLHGTKE